MEGEDYDFPPRIRPGRRYRASPRAAEEEEVEEGGEGLRAGAGAVSYPSSGNPASPRLWDNISRGREREEAGEENKK